MTAFAPLTLGTVQLGLAYGIANVSGKPDLPQAQDILETALRMGFRYLDTAPAYGNSEETLGKLLPTVDPTAAAGVISKIPAGVNPSQWEQQLNGSLERLGRSSLSAWLLHDEADFARIDAPTQAMIEGVKNAGRIGNFGVSCYSVAVAEAAVQSPLVTALQVPGNVFDRRFFDSPALAAAAREKVTIFVRSVFLQGLCLMPPDKVPARLPGAVEATSLLREFCADHCLSPQAFCLQYVNHRMRHLRHSLVLGVETAAHLLDLAAAMAVPSLAEEVFLQWEAEWPESPPELVNPSLWSQYR